MGLPERAVGVFQKVGECLYRYSSNGVYYARIKVHGKEIRRSLGTIDRDLAKRRISVLKQELSQTDRSKSRLTLAELCDQFLKTVQHQKAKTVERKTHIVARIKRDWPGGSTWQVSKIKPSDVQLWLARYSFGPGSRNLHRENEIQQKTSKPLGQKTSERTCAVALLSWRAELNGSLCGLVNFLWCDQYRHSRFNGCGGVGGQRQR
jgi:hypothetical protein